MIGIGKFEKKKEAEPESKLIHAILPRLGIGI
jgi:hypothetical protein